jgi:Asp-tRNA(Asn)/Glu-tRNA(Gln) amidotransferase A subunit family amidase
MAATLDTVGLYARDIPGLARALQVLIAADPEDPDNQSHTVTGLDDAFIEGPKRRWRVGIARTPVWDRLELYTQSLIDGFVERLAKRVTVIDVDLPPSFRRAHQEHLVIQDHGISSLLYPTYITVPGSFSTEITEMILRGHGLPSSRITEALEWQRRMTAEMDEALSQVDVAVTAAATGEAPATLERTGDPVMSTIWSFTGTPALSIPRFTGPHGLPVGLQVVARRNCDADVLGFAAFLEATGI